MYFRSLKAHSKDGNDFDDRPVGAIISYSTGGF